MLNVLALVFEESANPIRTDIPDAALVTPGTIGGIFFFSMAIAVFFLWRSMTRHLKKIDAPRENQ